MDGPSKLILMDVSGYQFMLFSEEKVLEKMKMVLVST